MSWTLVTGAAKRLGREVALHLAEKGHHLLIHYHMSKEAAEETAQQCRLKGARARVIQGDFSSQREISTFLARIENVKYLVNNVGAYWMQSGLETSLEKWEELFQFNFFAPIALIQGLALELKKQKGAIVNIGSVGVGIFRADTKYTAYTLSKTALFLLTKSLAKEFAPENVRVNMVSPGELENSQTVLENQSKLPMGRPGTCEEVARAVAFLLDEENASYITGQNIEVGGGFVL